jgi:hypothetical protein
LVGERVVIGIPAPLDWHKDQPSKPTELAYSVLHVVENAIDILGMLEIKRPHTLMLILRIQRMCRYLMKSRRLTNSLMGLRNYTAESIHQATKRLC